MNSQPNTEARRTGNGTRKGHQSGSGPRTPGMYLDQGNTTRFGRQVPSSPYGEFPVPSVSSENGIMSPSPYTNQSYAASPYPNPPSYAASPYTNQSSYAASPYPNPPSYAASPYTNQSSYEASPYTNQSSYAASPYPNTPSNAETVDTPFNFLEDNLLHNENTYKNVSAVPSPAPILSSGKKRNSGPGYTLCLLPTNGTKVSSVNENSGPSRSKKIKKTVLPELSEQNISDAFALVEEQIQNEILVAHAVKEEQQQRNNEIVNDQANTEQFQMNETLVTDEVTEEQSQSKEIPRHQFNAEQSRGNDTLFNDEDLSKAHEDNVDTWFLKQTLEEMGRSILNASYKIGPGIPISSVQRLTLLANRIHLVWDAEWASVLQQSVPTVNEPVNGIDGSAVTSAPAPNKNTNKNGVPPQFSVKNDRQNNSRNRSPFPQGSQVSPQQFLRNNNSTQQITAPRSSNSTVVVDGLGSVHSLGSSNQNGLQTGLQNLNSNFTFPVSLSHGEQFRLERVAPFTQASVIAQNQMTFHAATVNVSLPQGTQQLSLSRPLISGLENQAQYAVIKVGNTAYRVSHSDWAAVSESSNKSKMIKALVDKFFTLQEQLNSTVSGRKSKSKLPGLNPLRMLALYACVAYLRQNPNQFPTDPIDSSVHNLNDAEKKEINSIVSQKLNATKQQHSRKQGQDST